MSALTSRRAVLAALAALPAAKGAAGATSIPGGEVEPLWCEWVESHRTMNGPIKPPDDFDQLHARMNVLERAIADAAPSPMRAAATAMIEIAFAVLPDQAPSSARRHEDAGSWFLVQVLPCLLPYLFGHVAECAADIAANPDRPLRKSTLFDLAPSHST